MQAVSAIHANASAPLLGDEPARSRLAIVPCTITRAREFVGATHRRLRPPLSGLFAVGIALDDTLCGVAIAGRPVARRLDDGATIEVTRVATTGARNACSALYGAIWRAARALGYRRAITYTLASEPGASLRAGGWRAVAETRGGSWSRTERPRDDNHSTDRKVRWQLSIDDRHGDGAAPMHAQRIAANDNHNAEGVNRD